jgi:hypothetical protein
MKKNLNEQVSRIKQMMGINEANVNLDDYKDESSIIEDIKRVGTTDDGYPITSMKLNTFVPNADSQTEGNSVKIEVILEWESDTSTKYVDGFKLKNVSGVIADVGLGEKSMKKLRSMFSGHPTPKDLVGSIYGPFLINSSGKGFDYTDKILDNMLKDTKILVNVLTGEQTQQAEPEIQDAPEVAPEREIDKSDTWTSNSSW